jgi:Na+/H+ antiporter 1
VRGVGGDYRRPSLALAPHQLALRGITDGRRLGRADGHTGMNGSRLLSPPLGIVSACALAVRVGVAVKAEAYSWLQLIGAGALAGIGFTMSLFIAGQALPRERDFVAAKLAVLGASVVSSAVER